jgi:hypothetical protein
MAKTLVDAAEALHTYIIQAEADLQARDAADELSSWSLEEIRIMRAGLKKTLERLTVEDQLFADETLEGYSDAELGDMLVNARNSSRRLATLSAAIFYQPAVTALKPDGYAPPSSHKDLKPTASAREPIYKPIQKPMGPAKRGAEGWQNDAGWGQEDPLLQACTAR